MFESLRSSLNHPAVDGFLETLAKATNGEPLLFLFEVGPAGTELSLEETLRELWRSPVYLEAYRTELRRIDCGDDPDEPWMVSAPVVDAVPLRNMTPREVAGRLLELLLKDWWYRGNTPLDERLGKAMGFAKALSTALPSGASPKSSALEAADAVLKQQCPEGMGIDSFRQGCSELSALLPTGWDWFTVQGPLAENVPVHFWWNFPCDEAFVARRGSSLLLLYVTGTD